MVLETLEAEDQAQLEREALPDGWAWTTLDEIAELVGGGTPSREVPEYFTGDIVWLTPTEVPKDRISVLYSSRERITEEALRRSSARLVPEGSVLLTSRASIGYVAIAGVPLTTNQGFASFICRDGVYNHYLAYWLWATAEHFEESATGTTFKEITKSKLRPWPLPLPPLPEQRRIVAKIEELFTQLDAGVAALKRVRTNLQRYKASALKAACEGKLVPQDPTDEPASQLLQRILAERRARWEADLRAKGKDPAKARYEAPAQSDNEGLPELPEGWCWASLAQCATRITDGTHQPPPFTDSGIPFVFVKHIVGGAISFESTKFISQATYERLNDRCPVEVGDLLYSAVGSYGVAVPVRTQRPFSFQRHIAHIKTIGLVSTEYLAICLNSDLGQRQAHLVARVLRRRR